MQSIDIPYQKLRIFGEWLGIDEDVFSRLNSFAPFFSSRKEEFARYFHDFFMKIPEAKFIIQHQETPGHLLEVWALWFESLFSNRMDEEFLGYLWRVGLRHVEVNLDQRFSILGFSVVRQYCEQLMRSELPEKGRADIMRLIDKVVDFCILVETNSYIGGTSRCDREIMKGLADRIRNPVAVIGGHINRLMKKSGHEDPAYVTYEFISSQSTKCERMLKDIKTYVEILERDPSFERISLSELITEALEDLLSRKAYNKPVVQMDIEDEALYIQADRRNMRALFEKLIENCLEALDEKNPVIRISSRLEDVRTHSLIVELFNTGTPLSEEDSEKIFSPFYSTKPGGSGFGLSIAREAVRKNMGRLRLEPVGHEGTRVVISLPLYEQEGSLPPV